MDSNSYRAEKNALLEKYAGLIRDDDMKRIRELMGCMDGSPPCGPSSAEDRLDAIRYRWLRNDSKDQALEQTHTRTI